MGNRQFGVSASTAQEDEHSQNAQKTTDKEAEGEKRIWASHMYTVRENHDSCNMKPIWQSKLRSEFHLRDSFCVRFC